MNQIQRAYKKAKADHEAVEKLIAKIEGDYITAHGIKNPDGTIPAYSWMIDDEEVMETMLKDLEGELEKLEAWKIREALKKAEDDLINYGFSILPQMKGRDKVEKKLLGSGAIISLRQEWIAQIMRLSGTDKILSVQGA
jgi:hypothetical protein